MQISQKHKTFSEFFSGILKSRLYFQHFEKSMTLIVYLVPKLRTPKSTVT